MKSRIHGNLALAATLGLAAAASVSAKPGDAYPNWGLFGSGQAFVSFDLGGNLSDTAVDSAVGEDGSLYIVGRVAGEFGYSKIGIAKLRPDGGLDASFNQDGMNTSLLQNVAATSMALGETYIYVAGYTTNSLPDSDMVVCRFVRSTGANAPFLTSDNYPCVTPDAFPGGQDVANDIILQPDGKFVIAGTMGSPGQTYAAFARFESNGERDDSFGDAQDTSNLRLIRNANLYEGHTIRALARESNGALAAVGSTRRVGETGDSALIIRLDENGGGGTPEFVFDLDGSPSRNTVLHDVVAVDIPTKFDQLVVAGLVELTNDKNSGLLAKVYSQVDDLVPIFGEENGFTTITESESFAFTNLALEPKGGIVALGVRQSATALEVKRFNASGNPDDFFGDGGSALIDFHLPGNTHGPASVVVQGDATYVTGWAVKQLNTTDTDYVATKLITGDFMFKDGFESL